MGARAIYKGVLRFGSQQVPVKFYSAVEDRKVHFRLLHEPDLEPVRQSMVDSVTHEEVPSAEIRKAYQVDEDTFVVLDDEELEELRPQSTREIRIESFVPRTSLDRAFYDRPYFLGPDGAPEDYFALVRALQRTHVIGIARWSMRKRPYFGALDLFGGHLGISTLHHAEEVIAVESLDVPASRSLQPKEIKLAEQLVGALEDEFDAESFADTYRDRVQELAQAKHSGKRVQLPKAKRRAPTPPSLSEALAKSLEHIKRRRAS